MAITLGEVITAARDRNPLFHRTRIPNAVLARYLTGYQRRLVSKASSLNPDVFAQQASILFDVRPENAPGVVGAGTAGGLPAKLAAGQPAEVEAPAGAALELDFEGGQVLVSEFVVSAATATSLTKTGAGWTVNQWQGKYVWITDGPALDQRRAILSNTADTLVVSTGSDGQQFATVPTAGQSLAEVVDVTSEITEELGVVTALPPFLDRIGYLVRLNAQGVPFIDLTKPLLARFEVGIELPPHELLLGGTVHAGQEQPDLTIYRYVQRWAMGINGYSAYEMGGKFYLIGDQRIWAGVSAIDLRYVPIPPAFTALTDYFLLEEPAYDTLVARSAHLMGVRVNALPDSPKVELAELADEAREAEQTFLDGIVRPVRRATKFVRSVW